MDKITVLLATFMIFGFSYPMDIQDYNQTLRKCVFGIACLAIFTFLTLEPDSFGYLYIIIAAIQGLGICMTYIIFDKFQYNIWSAAIGIDTLFILYCIKSLLTSKAPDLIILEQ